MADQRPETEQPNTVGQPPPKQGWRGWSTRKKAIVGGVIAIMVLGVIGSITNPRTPAGGAPTGTPPGLSAVSPTPAAPAAPPVLSTPTLRPTPTSRPTPTPPPTIGRFTQTWSLPYGDTTCRHWVQEMNDHERRVAATDMLLGAHRSDLPNAPIPPAPQATLFENAITDACRGAGEELGIRLTEVAATLYVMSADFRP